MESLRIVADTNVLISGLCFGGPPGRIIEAALTGKVVLCTSEPLIEEFARVMKLKFPDRESALQDTFSELAILWQVAQSRDLPNISAVAEDPSDDKVLECAVASAVNCIVSGDKHLLVLGRYGGIAILSPSQFLSSFKL